MQRPLANSEIDRYNGKCLYVLDCTAFSCYKKENEQSCGQDTSFSTSVTLGDYPLLLVVKKTFWGRGSCVISCISIYVFGGRYESFQSFGLT